MKQVLRKACAVAIIVFMAACGTTGKKENTVAKTDSIMHDDHEISEMNNPVKSTITINDDQLNAILPHYVSLTTALVNEDVAGARIASNAIEAGARELKGNGAADIANHAGKITISPDIGSQRKAFAVLSSNYMDLIKKSGLVSGQLYVDFCPMALNDQGAYWINTSKEIKNPYFGQEMLTCGEVKDSIK